MNTTPYPKNYPIPGLFKSNTRVLPFTSRRMRREKAKRYYRENRGIIAERQAWYRYTHREELGAKAEYRKRYGKTGHPYPRIRAKKMKDIFKVQLHPGAAKATIEGREAVEKVIALYRRLTKANISAAPFFAFPIDPAKWGTLPIVVPIVISGENKEAYRATLTYALEGLQRVEYHRAGMIYPEAGTDALRVLKEAAKKEAEDTLSLIAEYRRLPQEATNKARLTED